MKNIRLIRSLPQKALVGCLLLVCSCDQDKYVFWIPSVTGHYQLISARTDQEIDLNNDGQISNDLAAEIDEFDFQFIKSYMEIRPMKHNNSGFKFIEIPFPHPNYLFGFPEDPNGYIMYTKNSIGGTGYQYDFDEKTKIITLKRDDSHIEEEATWGRLAEIKVKDDNLLELEITKDYYDFYTTQMQTLKITALYERAE